MRLKLVITLAMGQFARGCAGNLPPQPQTGEIFAAPLPPLSSGDALTWVWPWLAGLGIGLTLGCCLTHLWRRRYLVRVMQDPGSVPPQDLARLQAILRLMDELALNWRRREQVKPLPIRKPPGGR